MGGFGLFLGEFSDRLRQKREHERDLARQDDEKELEILRTLAVSGGPGIREAAGAALLDLAAAGPGKRPRAKGIRGFLGETARSPHLDAVRNAMNQPGQATSTLSAALPSTSPVQPGAPPMPALASAQGPVAPQRVDGVTSMEPLGPQGPPPLQAFDTTVSRMLPPEPKIRSLFPTAEEVAQEQAQGNLQGRIQAVLSGYRQAQTPEERRLIEGLSGVPQRRLAPIPMILTVDGQETVGLFDPETKTYTVNGQSVQPTSARRMPSTIPRGPNPQLRVMENGEYGWFTPPSLEQPVQTGPAPPAEPIGTRFGPPQLEHPVERPGVVGTGVKRPPPTPPPVFSGTATVMDETTGEPVVRRLPRGGGPETVGKAPPRAGVKSEEQKQYEVWLKQVDQQIAALGRNRLTGRTQVLTPQQRDDIARQVTGVKEMTYNELSMGAKGTSYGRGARSGKSREDINRLIETIRQGYGGSTAPPPPPR